MWYQVSSGAETCRRVLGKTSVPQPVAKPWVRIDAFKAIGLTRSLRERAAERKQWGLPHRLSGGWVRGSSQSSRRGEGTGEHTAAPGSESSLGKGVAVGGWVIPSYLGFGNKGGVAL